MNKQKSLAVARFAVKLFSSVYPDDNRPILAVQKTTMFLNGMVSKKEATDASWEAGAATEDARFNCQQTKNRREQNRRLMAYWAAHAVALATSSVVGSIVKEAKHSARLSLNSLGSAVVFSRCC